MLSIRDVGEILWDLSRRVQSLEVGRVIPVTSFENLVAEQSFRLRFDNSMYQKTILTSDIDGYVQKELLTSVLFSQPDQITITGRPDGTVEFTLPQNIAPTSVPTFSGLNLLGDLTTIGKVDGVNIYPFYSSYQAHISNNTTAHFGQDLRATASPHFYDLTIANNINVLGLVDGVDVALLNSTLQTHTNNATIHFTEASIDHTHIQNVGLRTHTEIDTHIADTTTAHGWQNLATTATPTFDNVILTGTPLNSYNAINKGYVDSMGLGLYWQPSVKEIYDPTGGLPISPLLGDRYISYATANGWTVNKIYEWDMTQWVETTPSTGWAIWVRGGSYEPNGDVVYNGTAWVRFGTSQDHQSLIGAGVYTHANIDAHINNTSIHFTEASIDHTHIQNVGTNTHADIDSHISNDTTAHFGQGLKSTDTPTFDQVVISSQPSLIEHVATKQYVDSQIQSIDYQKSVLGFHDPSTGLPISPSLGDRYIASDSGNGWIINRIYEWNNTLWMETVPNIGFNVYVEDGTMFSGQTVFYNGSLWTSIAVTVEHTLLRNRGTYTHAEIDTHIDDTTIHFTEASIQHQNILGHGTYTHDNIDSHINNNTDAHFGQDLKSTATPTFARVISGAQPTAGYHLANKSYVDAVAQGIDWHEPVLAFYDPTSALPVLPDIGDRYISLATANGWVKDNIYTWNGSIWDVYAAHRGCAVFVEGGPVYPQSSVIYDGTSWIKFMSVIDHKSLINIGINTHDQIDTHIADATIHYTQSQIDHTLIQNRGTNTHSDIDSHISNDTTAHFGQGLKSTDTPTFALMTLSNSPDADSDAVRKDYVDTWRRQLTWQKSVLSVYDPTLTLPLTPTEGDRYISAATANGWFVNHIYEYHINAWIDTAPTDGFMAWITDGTVNSANYVYYQSGQWLRLGTKIDHTDLINKGSFTHSDIDGHINNSSSAHGWQNLATTATPTFAQVQLGTPTANNNGATKEYVDTQIQTVDWQRSVLSFYDPTSGLPVSPTYGDRYISLTTANTWVKDMIYEYKGVSIGWVETLVNTGYCTFVEGGALYPLTMVLFKNPVDGWIPFGATVDHTTLKSIGTNSHSDIDNHISNNSSAHFGQDLRATATPAFTKLSITSTEQTTDITSGSLVITTGLGVGTSIYVGKNVDIVDNLYIHGTFDATAISTGALIIDTGASIGSNLVVGNQTSTKTLFVYGTEQSTSSTTGTVIVTGGIATQSNLNVGQDLSVGANTQIQGTLGVTGVSTLNVTHIVSTINSTSAASGALVLDGGLGVMRDTNMNGKLFVNNTTESTSTTTGAVILNGGLAVAKNVFINGTTTLLNSLTGTQATMNTVTVNGTINSTSASTGSLIVSTGAGIGGKLNVGGTANISGLLTGSDATFNNITIISGQESTDISSGAVIISGGLAVKNNLNVGGDVTIGGLLASNDSTMTRIHLTDTSEATDPTSGALWVEGGISTNMSIYADFDLTINGQSNLNNVVVQSGLNSTSISTGAIRVIGGVGMGGALHTGGQVVTHSTVASTSYTTGSLITYGGVGIDGAINASGNVNAQAGTLTTLHITNTDNTTSASTGSLIIDGGVHIAKDISVAGSMSISGSLAYESSAISSTAEATSSSTGALIVAGGISAGKSIYIGNNLTVNNTSTLHDTYIMSTVQSTSATTGALNVVGGVGIQGNENIGGNLSVAGIATMTSQVYVLSTVNSTSPTTGSLVVDGGMGVATDFVIGGIASLPIANVGQLNITNTIESTSTNTGSVIVNSGVGIAKNVNIGGSLTSTSATIPIVNVSGTVNSSSATTGSLLVTSGVGIGGNANIAGNMSALNGVFNSTTEATNTASGAVTVLGGLGVAKQAYFGTNVDIANNLHTLTAHVLGTDNATSSSTGSLLIDGGAGFSKNVYVAGSLNAQSTSLLNVLVIATTETTSATTGALQVIGGIATQKSLSVGLNETIYGTTQSTSSSTGSLIVNGGAGFMKNIYVGGNEVISGTLSAGASTMTTLNISTTTESTSTSTGSTIMYGGLGLAKNLNVGGNLNVVGSGTMPTLSVTSTVQATDTLTGALHVEGGASFGKTLIGANIKVVETTEATDTVTGSLIINGGVSSAKNAFIGGRITTQGVTSSDLKLVSGSRRATLQATTMASDYTLTLPSALPATTPSALVADTSGNFTWNNQMFIATNVKTVRSVPNVGEYATIEAAINACSSPSDINRYLIIVTAGKYSENELTVPPFVVITGSATESVSVTTSGNHNLFNMSISSALYFMTLENVQQVAISIIDCSAYVELYGLVIQYCNTGIYLKADTMDCEVYMNGVDCAYSTVAELVLDDADFEMYVNFLNCTFSSEVSYGSLTMTIGKGAYIVGNNVTFMGDTTTGYDGIGCEIKGGATVIIGGFTAYNFTKALYMPTSADASVVEISSGNMHGNVADIDCESVNVNGYYFGVIIRTTSTFLSPGFYIYGLDSTIIKVAKNGGDYSSLKSAITAITDATSTKQYVIQIQPGTYIEDPFSMKNYVNVTGAEFGSVIVQASTSGTHFITFASESLMRNIVIKGSLGSDNYALIYNPGVPGMPKQSRIERCRFGNTDTCIIMDTSGGGMSNVTMKWCEIDAVSQFKYFVRQTAGVSTRTACYVDSMFTQVMSASLNTFFEVSGALASFVVVNSTIVNSGGVGKFISASDGINVIVSGCAVTRFDTAIYVPNVGTGPILNVELTTQDTITKDVNVLNSTTTGNIYSYMNMSKVTSNANGLSMLIRGAGLTIVGNLSVGDTVANVTDFTPSLKYGTNLGITTGGVLTMSGLDATVTAGTGYIADGTAPNDVVRYLTWTQQTVTLPANSYRYVYVNSSSTIAVSSTDPSLREAILIASVYTGATDAIYIQQLHADSHYTGSNLEQVNRYAFGPIVSSGVIASPSTTALKIDVNGGTYYYGTNKYTPSSNTDITMYTFYHDGSGGWTRGIASDVEAKWDDNSGTLQDVTVGNRVKHALYVTSSQDGSTTTYLLVYGQEEFNSAAAAVAGNMPIPPTFFEESMISVAGIVVYNPLIGSDSIEAVTDTRPTIAFKSGGQTATTDHNSLSNLAVGDAHPQYFRTDGTRVMGGDIQMGGNDVSGLGNLISPTNDTMNAFAHAARHVPNGADPLAVGTPVAIGTTNAEGNANLFARSNHVHDHGTQTSGTLHAAATTSINGFMSSTDKQKLDNATDSDIADRLVIRSTTNSFSVGTLVLTGTDISEDSSSGALIVYGGIGMAGDLRLGGQVYADSNINGLNANFQTLTISGTSNASSIYTGVVTVVGGVGIGGKLYAGELISNSGISGTIGRFSSTTDATDTSTGTLVVHGGASIAKNAYIGGNTNITGTLSAAGATLTSVSVTNATSSTSVTTGALIIGGGTGINENLYVGGYANIADSVSALSLSLNSTVNSTSTTTGALILVGGLGLGGNINAGGNLNAGNGTLTTLDVSSNTQSTDTLTGAVIVTGGMSLGRQLYVGGSAYFQNTLSAGASTLGTTNITATNNSTDTYTGAIIIAGGASVKKDIVVGGTIKAPTANLTVVNVTGTVDATSTTTGTIIISGGASVAKSMYVGDSIYMTNNTTSKRIYITGTNDAVDTNTGVLNVLGGVSIAKNIYSGQGVFATTGTFSTGAITSTTESTDTMTGAFILSGGLGVAKNANIGGTLHAFSSVVDSTVNATSASTGSLIVLGGAGIEKDVRIGGNLYITGGLAYDTAIVSSTINSTSSTTGALQIVGGVGVGADMFIENKLTANNGYFQTINVNSAIESTDTLTGGLIIDSGIAIAKNTNIGGQLSATTGIITSTIEASDTLTGALHVIGGVSIEKDLYIGDNLYVTNEIVANLVTTNTIYANSTVDASSATTGSLVVAGGVGIDKKLYVNGTATFVSDVMINSTTNSGATNSGSLTTIGGVGIAKDLHVGGQITGHTTLHLLGTINTSSATTGSLVVDSGVGIGGKLFVAGEMTSDNLVHVISTVNSTDTLTGALNVNGGVGIGADVHIGGSLVGHGLVHSLNTTNATDTLTGSVIVDGGVSIAKDIFIHGVLTTNNVIANTLTTESTSTSTGSVILSGGFAIAKNANIGGDMTISNIGYFQNTTNATDTVTGAVIMSGGLGLAKDVHVGGLIRAHSTVNSTSVSTGSVVVLGGMGITSNTTMGGQLNVTSNVGSTDTLTGATTIVGGLGIGQNANIGGTLNVTGQTTLTSLQSSTVQTTSTVNATSVSTGSLIIAGGFGATSDAFIGGLTTASTLLTTSTVDATDTASGSVHVIGGMSVAKNLYVGNVLVSNSYSTNHIHILSTDNSTSSTTGALIVDGGAGIQRDLVIGGNVTAVNGTLSTMNITSATDTTSATTGSLVVVGGMGINKIYASGNITSASLTTNQQSTTGLADATDTLTGSTIISGGASVGKSMYIGQNLHTLGQTYANTLNIASTINSTDTLTGSLTITSGVGIGGNVNIGGNTGIIGTFNISNTTEATDAVTGSIITLGGIGISKNAHINGIAHIHNTTESTSADSGAIIIDGGIGINKNVNTNGILTVNNTTESTDVTTGSVILKGGMGIDKNLIVNGIIKALNTTESTSTSTGSVIFNGGVAIQKNLFVNGVETIVNTNDATSTTTGSLIVSGGVNIIKNLLVSGITSELNTTESTSATTGSLIMSGGLGVQKNANIQGITHIYNATNTTSVGTGAFIVDGGASIGANLYVGGDNNITGKIKGYGIATFAATDDSTDTTTGGVIIDGGIGIKKNLHVDKAYIDNTADSTNATTGSLIISGGVGAQKNMNIGGRTTSNGLTSYDIQLTNALKKVTLLASVMASDYTLSLPTSLPSGAISNLVADASGNMSWNNQLYTYNNIKVVSKTPKPGQFSTIEAACASISGSSIYNPFMVLVEPGFYAENQIIVPEYVAISGQFYQSVFITATGAFDLIMMQSNSSLVNLAIISVSGTGISIIDNVPTTILDNVNILYCNIGIYMVSYTHESQVLLKTVFVQDCATACIVIDNSLFTMNVALNDVSCVLASTIPPVCISAGVNANVICGSLQFIGKVAGGTAMQVLGGAIMIVQSIAIYTFDKGIVAPNSIYPANITIASGNMVGVNTGITIENPAVSGYYFGVVDRMNCIIPSVSPFYIYNTYPTLINVSNKGGDYTSIKTALAAITTATDSNQYVIRVYPGQYIEDPFSTKDYVHIQGVGGSPAGIVVKPSTTGTHFITHASNSSLAYLTFSGQLGSSNYAHVYCPGSVILKKPTLTYCLFDDVTCAIIQDTTVGSSNLALTSCGIANGTDVEYAVKVSAVSPATAICYITNTYATLAGTSLISYRSVTGSTAKMIITNGTIINNAQTGKFITISDGATVTISGTNVTGFDTGIYVPNTGNGPNITGDIVIEDTGTYDINILNPTASGFLRGTANLAKINTVTTNVALQFSTNDGLVLTGNLYIGESVSTITNVSSALKHATNIGLIHGGDYSAVGLDVTIASGNGYVSAGTIPNEVVKYVTWVEQTVTTTANSLNYLYINASGVLQTNISKPNTFNNIIICSAFTNATDVVYYQDIENQSDYTASTTERTMKSAFGAIVSNGLLTTENVTPLHIDVSSGTYYYGNVSFGCSPSTNISMLTHYRDGSSGWTRGTSSAVEAKWDDNSGTLQTMSNSTYVKHALCLNSDSLGNKTFFLVYGQETFASEATARAGNMPLQPPNFIETVVDISGIIVYKDGVSAVSIAGFVDVRPTISFRSGGSTATTDHNSLSNLTTGDAHTQYVRTDGTRVMGGDLQMGGNDVSGLANLISVSLDTMNPFGHAARHNPNGTDPLAVGTPVAIGTANADGNANSFARSNHVHDHGAQTSGTLHVAATTLVNGFMSSSDKLKLDNATSSNTASTLVLRDATGGFSMGDLSIASATLSTSTSTGALIVTGGASFGSLMNTMCINSHCTLESTSTTTGALILDGGIGVAKSMYIGGLVNVLSTVQSTSATTGALIVTGGIGIGDSLNVAGSANIAGAMTVGSLSLGSLNITGTTEATTTSTGTLIVSGGLGLAKNMYIGGNTIITGTLQSGAGTLTTLNTTSTTESTSTNTGSVILAGGLGIAKNVNIGGNTVILGTFQSGSGTMTTLSVSSANDSTSTTTGSLILTGGAGIAKNVHIGDSIYVTNGISSNSVTSAISNITSTVVSTDYTTGALVVSGGVGINSDVRVNGVVYSNSINVQTIAIQSTTESTSTTTGSLVLGGGLGIGKNLNVGGNVNISGATSVTTLNASTTTNATDTLTGSFILSGGVGIAKDTYIGGLLKVNGTLNSGAGTMTTLSLSSNTGSTSSTTGTLIVTGGVGISSNLNVGNSITSLTSTITSTTESTNTLTGSVIINGGVAIAKNVNIGNNVNIGSNVTATSGSITTLTVAGTVESTSTTSGSLIVNSGLGLAKNLYVGGNANISGSLTTGSLTITTLSVLTTTESTSTSSGSVIIAGGLGIAKDTYIGGLLKVNGTLNSGAGTMTTLSLSANTGSTSSSTGTLIVTGGAGISSNLNVGNSITSLTSTITSTTESTNTLTGSVIINGGVAIAKNVNIGNNVTATSGSMTTLTVAGTVESTSTTSGSLIVNSGLGLAKNLYVGGNANISGSLTTGSLTITTLSVLTTTESTSTSSGSVIIAGGLGLAKNLHVGGTFTSGIGSMPSLSLTSATNSTSSTTGTLVITGGLGLGSDAYVSGGISTNIITVRSTVNSSDSTTGSVLVTGGLGISGNANIGGSVGITGLTTLTTLTVTTTTESTSTNTGSVLIAGGVGFAKNAYFGGNVGITGTFNAGATTLTTLNSTTTTDSTSTSTGSLQIAGGVGIARNAYIGGNVGITGTLNTGATTDSTSTSTGSLQIAGGVGIARNVYIGGNVGITGTLNSGAGTMTTLNTTSTTESTTTSTGSMILAGGLGIARNAYIGGNVGITGTLQSGAGTMTTLNLTSAIDSTSTSTGSLTIAGGAGIAGNLYTKGAITSRGGVVCANNLDESIFSMYASTGTTSIECADAFGDIPLKVYCSEFEINAPLTKIVTTAESTSTTTGSLVLGGGLGIGKSLNVGGSLNVVSTTDATTTTTGAILVAGGVGIAKALSVGTKSYLNGDVNVLSVTDATTTTTGAILVTGGVGIAKALSVGTTSYFTGNMSVYSTTDATTTTTGAILLSGGIGIARSLSVGNGSYFSGVMNVYNTTDTSATNSGAIIVAGGVGIAKTMTSNIVRAKAGIEASDATTGTVIVTGGVGVSGRVYCANASVAVQLRTDSITEFTTTNGVTIASGSKFYVANNTNSTSSDTGAEVITGGLGVGLSTYIGGTLGVQLTTDSGATNAGAVIISGGVGIAKQLRVGTNATISGTLGAGATTVTTLNATATTVSSDTATGALIVAGGAGIGGQLSTATARIFTTTDSGATNTGAMIVSGGLGVAKTIYATTVIPTNLTMTQNVTKIDIDGTLAANLDTNLPTQKAVKTYADSKFMTTWFISDQKTSGTDGGNATGGAWGTRTLNTISGDTANTSVTLGTNLFNINSPGRYNIVAHSSFVGTRQTKLSIYDVTNNIDYPSLNTINITNATEGSNSGCIVTAETLVTITTTPIVFRIDYYCVTTRNGWGLGSAVNAGIPEVYTWVRVVKYDKLAYGAV